MDKLMRFSDYDVFAYISSGAIALALFDLIAGTHFLVGAGWTVAQGVLTIIGTYVLGQILAGPAAWLWERNLVRRVLGKPSDILLGLYAPKGWGGRIAKALLGDYYSELEPAAKTRLQNVMKRKHLTTGEGLFWLAFPEVKSEPITYSRLSSFLNLYGFARNMAFVLMVGGIGLLISTLSRSPSVAADHRVAWGVVALIAAVGMIHRYLKFLRLYAVEVFTTFDAIERHRYED